MFRLDAIGRFDGAESDAMLMSSPGAGMRKLERIRGLMMRGPVFRHTNRLRFFLLVFVLLSGVGLLASIAWRQRPPPVAEAASLLVGERGASYTHADKHTIQWPVERTASPKPQDSHGSITSESLETSFDRLAADADSGDRVSACFLSRALALCEEAEKLRQEGSHWIDVATRADIASSDENFAINKIVEIEYMAGNASTICKGLSPAHQRETVARMFQAAELGDPQAMTHYALYSEPPEKGGGTREQFDGLYRKHAVVMLERSASMGNLRALRALYEVYLHGVSPNRDDSVHVEKDPAAAIAIGTALLDRVSTRERQYIAVTLDQIEKKPDVLSSKRYASLQKKYVGYSDEIALNGFDESGKNLDMRSCKKYGDAAQ